MNQKNKKKWIPAIIVLGIVLCILAIIIIFTKGNSDSKQEFLGTSDQNMENGTGFSKENAEMNSNIEQQDSTEKNTDTSDATQKESEQNGTEAQAIEEDKTESHNTDTETVKKADASYEEWLAAGMIVAISMQYPDFNISEVYLADETEISSHENSKGAYVIFTSKEKNMVVYSTPLKEERTERGTIDLSTSDLGFATFDVVKENSINKESCQKVELEDLTELIKQSMLVSIYEH